MKITLLKAPACLAAFIFMTANSHAKDQQLMPNSVIAIGIILEPDATMRQHAADNNARLLNVYPDGYSLDAAHPPHMTLIQRYVKSEDLTRLYAAANKVLAKNNVKAIVLEAYKYYYMPSGPTGLAGIVAKPTPELIQLQADLLVAIAPFTVESGDSSAFFTTPKEPIMDPEFIQYVATFVPNQTGEHYNPHVSTGIGLKESLDAMLTEPFQSFKFSPTGVAVYQLGQFGTAAKKLQSLELQP